MGVYTKEEQFKLIKKGWTNLKNIDNQYKEVCLEAVKLDGWALQLVKEQTPEICLEAVKQNGWALRYVKEQTPEICLEAVKQNGWALQYVKKQTPEICLVAVKQNGWALEYVKEQTAEICLEAVKRDGYALQFVKEQTEEVCLEAVKQEASYIKKVKNKNPELCFYAFINDYDLLTYKYIKTGIDKYIKSNSIENKIFCTKSLRKFKNADFYFDVRSLEYLKNYLLKENSNNKFILNDIEDINVLKEIAISNNELIIVNTGNIQNIHKMLANKIITEEDLIKESF